MVGLYQVLGTPTREEIRCINPNYNDFRFPQIKAHPWHRVFHKRMPPEAIDLASRLLQYSPSLRCNALEAIAHPFFDELRQPNVHLPNGVMDDRYLLSSTSNKRSIYGAHQQVNSGLCEEANEYAGSAGCCGVMDI
ncbi:putative protein-serine/threonine kinase [Helianthus anomalus]